ARASTIYSGLARHYLWRARAGAARRPLPPGPSNSPFHAAATGEPVAWEPTWTPSAGTPPRHGTGHERRDDRGAPGEAGHGGRGGRRAGLPRLRALPAQGRPAPAAGHGPRPA